MDSILTSIKKLLGITEEYEEFDTDIIIHINSVLATLYQLGVGPESGFSITDSSSTWSDFIGENNVLIDLVKTYVYYKVRLAFDPPTNGTHIESMNKLMNEQEFRIRSMVDWGAKTEE